MKPIYLNLKSSYGLETVDEFTREENQSPREFRQYVNEMVREYHLAGMNVYKSSRCTNDWKDKELNEVVKQPNEFELQSLREQEQHEQNLLCPQRENY